MEMVRLFLIVLEFQVTRPHLSVTFETETKKLDKEIPEFLYYSSARKTQIALNVYFLLNFKTVTVFEYTR